MTRTSCVRRIPSDLFIVIRASYVAVCGGDAVAAALISFFEYWHNLKLDQLRDNKHYNDVAERHGDERQQLETVLQFHTMADLSTGLMGIGGRHSIEKARDRLEQAGIITRHRNPNPRYKFDNTPYYEFHPEVVNKMIDTLFPPGPSAEISEQSPAAAPPSAEISKTITKDSLNDTNKKEVPAPSRGGKVAKPVKKTEPKTPAPPRDHWQALVDAWFMWYKEKHKGEEPNFLGRNPGLFGKLIDLLLNRARKKAKQAGREHQWTEDYATKSLRFFLDLAYSDDWLKKHFLLANLVDQFDAIYAREAVKKVQQAPPKPTVTNPYSGGSMTVSEELDYLLARYAEGNFEPRVVRPDHYDMLTGRGMLPVGTMANFEGATPEDQKHAAVMAWLKGMTKKSKA